MGYISFCSVQWYLGVVGCTLLKMISQLKTGCRRAKMTEIWDLGTIDTHIQGTPGLVDCSRSFGARWVHFSLNTLQLENGCLQSKQEHQEIIRSDGVPFGIECHK